jgi:hypothetical protein
MLDFGAGALLQNELSDMTIFNTEKTLYVINRNSMADG